MYLKIVEYTARIFSFDYITDIRQLFIVGRCYSFAFTLFGVLLIYKHSLKIIGTKAIALLISLIYLLLLTGHAYATRPDSLKVLLFLIFLIHFIDYFYENGSVKSKYVSLLAALFAVATKQDVIIYIALIIGVTFLIQRNKSIILYGISFVILAVFLFISFHIFFGNYCIESLFLYNLQKIKNYRESYNFMIVLFNTVRLSPFYMLFIFLLLKSLKSKQKSLGLLFGISGIMAAILSSIFLFRPGSYLNYTYELILISILALIYFLKNYTLKKTIIAADFYILFLLASNAVLNNYSINIKKEKKEKQKFQSNYQLRDALQTYLKTNSTIYDVTLQHSLFIADKRVIYGHEIHLDRLIYALLKLKSNSELYNAPTQKYDTYFADGSVQYILTTNKVSEQQIVSSFYPNYKEEKKINNFILYKFEKP
ncbi:MAG TPA: hypothetical protein PK355_08295 [Chitinophagales bacterium]|nr:hypothetical protein [Chitinophagales bacterium]